MSKKELTWEEVKEELNFTQAEKEEIQEEERIIMEEIELRKKLHLSQRDLSEKTGIKQPAIARIESNTCSPKVSTLIKILRPMGYTIKIVPIKNNKVKK